MTLSGGRQSQCPDEKTWAGHQPWLPSPSPVCPSGQRCQTNHMPQLERCLVPRAGTAPGSGAREVSGEGGRKGRRQEPGLGSSSGGDRGCSRVSRRLATCQGSQAGERQGNLGNSGAGQRAWRGPFAQEGTDPQGSLRRSQPPPAGNGSLVVPPSGTRRGSGGHGGA